MKLTKLFKNSLCALAAVSLSIFTVSCGGGDDAADAADAAGDAADAAADAAGDAADAAAEAAKPE